MRDEVTKKRENTCEWKNWHVKDHYKEWNY